MTLKLDEMCPFHSIWQLPLADLSHISNPPIAEFASAHVSGNFSYASLVCLAHWVSVIEDF